MKGLLRRWLAVALAAAALLRAADAPDQTAFDAAARDFDLGLWERADRNLADFETRFPGSPLLPEAGRRRLFARAEAAFGRADWDGAANLFADFQRTNAASSLAVLAAVREAETRKTAGQPAAGATALKAPEGVFAKALAKGEPAPILLRGLLVEAACLLAGNDATGASAVTEQAQTFARTPAEKAGVARALALAREAAGAWPGAADAAAHWVEIAGADPSLAPQRYEAASLAGRLSRRAGRNEPSAAFYRQCLTTNAPFGYYREAALNLGEFALAANDAAGARGILEACLAASPPDADGATLRLPLGQALFAQYLAARPDTNAAKAAALLELAARQFRLAATATNAPPAVTGPASLGLAWSLWESGTPAGGAPWLAAETNFAAAAALLPKGAPQAIARFKLGDCLMARSAADRAAAATALSNYLAVAQGYGDVPEAATLREPALWQAVVAAVATGDRDAAHAAMAALLQLNPKGEPAARSVLLVGQYYGKEGDDASARTLLADYLDKFPDSPLRPDVELAISSADLRAHRWTNAIAQLDRWLNANSNNPSRPRAEFDRAWANAQAGMATNAFEDFKNLAARYPGNPMAETALLWLADHFFDTDEYTKAEQACLVVVTNAAWRGNPAWQQARLIAAQSALRRESWASADEKLREILDDKTTPRDLLPFAYFSYGELLMNRPAPEKAPQPLLRFQEAADAFAAAAQFTNSRVLAPALGMIGNCQLQLAGRDPTNYSRALGSYTRVLQLPSADLDSRCIASYGAGGVLEKMAASASGADAVTLRDRALDAYLDIVQGRLLRPGEKMDPRWLKDAGREAGRLLEEAGRWEAAAALYDRLAVDLPAAAPAWKARASAARAPHSG